MEVERLYEHAWFAITETLLAMTIFRDDVGVWFFVMFVSLIAGKIWQWIGAGRVEFVEQQPPTSNEIFFHSRLASSLILSIVYDTMMLGYCVDTVLRQARPNMIVMFGFEYALLLIESCATFFRHILCLIDLTVQSKQTEAKRQELLEERRSERQRQREEAGEGILPEADLAAEDIEVDDNEIDVPGWEGKGRWVFYLDLAKGVYPDIAARGSKQLICDRLCQVDHLYGLLRHPHDVPRPAHSYHERCSVDVPFVPQAHLRLPTLPERYPRHELSLS